MSSTTAPEAPSASASVEGIEKEASSRHALSSLYYFGAAQFPSTASGAPSAPVKAFRDRLQHHPCTIVGVDEYLTSQLCSGCHHQLQHFHGVQEHPIFPGKVRVWNVKVCKNADCSHRMWNRDVNAAIYQYPISTSLHARKQQ